MTRAALLVSALLSTPVLVAPVFADGERGPGSVLPHGTRCGASREGMLACMAGRACLCRYERGGQMTGRPGGFRWDCGALRPDCAGPAGETAARDTPGGVPAWAEPPSR